MIWKALADPTRRTILDLLHEAPLTTGEINEQIEDLSRYAVMKHLGILEKANLITTRREGKFRWNQINTYPIKESYEQWLSQLLKLKRYAAQTTKSMGKTDQSITTTTLSFEVSLEASQAKVWKALTEEIGKWWPKEFYQRDDQKTGTNRLRLEATPGGLWVVDRGKAGGQVWGMVIGLEKQKSLLLKGHLTPELGGPAISFLHFVLQSHKQQTVLQFTDTIFGEISNKLNRSLKRDWEKILKKALKQYVEP